MSTFRSRASGEDMGSYLKAKQQYEVNSTGSSGIDLGGSANYNFTRPQSILDQKKQDYYSAIGGMPDETEIRRQEIEARQQQIDALNKVYADKIRQEQTAGVGRLGQQRSLASVTGMLGSPRGQAQKAGVEQYNKQQIDNINNQKQLALENIFSEIDKRVDKKVSDQKNLALRGMETQIADLEAQRQEDKKLAADFFKNGGDYDVLVDEDKQKLNELIGTDDPFMLEVFAEANRPADSKMNWDKRVIGNTLVWSAIDPKTGELKTIEHKLPVEEDMTEYETLMTPDGSLLFINPNDPSDVRRYGGKGEFAKPRATGGTTTSDEDKFRKDIEKALDQLNTGKRTWGEVYNMLKSKYPDAPSDVLDNLLDKEKWYKAGAYEAQTQARFKKDSLI